MQVQQSRANLVARPTKQARLLAAASWLCLLGLLSLAGCGDDPAKPAHDFSGGGGGAAVEAAVEAVSAELDLNYISLGKNPKWQPLTGLFADYTKLKIEAMENPMMAHLVDHLERPVIDGERAAPEKFVATSVEVEEDRPEEHDPRTWMALDRYTLIILMTGIARPKAVITTPNGTRYVLERGDPIGREGGRVKAILQYKMLVAVPKETEPRVVSIEPPLERLAGEAAVAKDF